MAALPDVNDGLFGIMNAISDESVFQRRIHEIIFYGSILCAGISVFVFLNWIAVLAAGLGAFAGLTVAYSAAARLWDLRRLDWGAFFSNFG